MRLYRVAFITSGSRVQGVVRWAFVGGGRKKYGGDMGGRVGRGRGTATGENLGEDNREV